MLSSTTGASSSASARSCSLVGSGGAAPFLAASFSASSRFCLAVLNVSFRWYVKVAPKGGLSAVKNAAPWNPLPRIPYGRASMYMTASRTVNSAAGLPSDSGVIDRSGA